MSFITIKDAHREIITQALRAFAEAEDKAAQTYSGYWAERATDSRDTALTALEAMDNATLTDTPDVEAEAMAVLKEIIHCRTESSKLVFDKDKKVKDRWNKRFGDALKEAYTLVYRKEIAQKKRSKS